jgi:di/tricarboxylate transporter
MGDRYLRLPPGVWATRMPAESLRVVLVFLVVLAALLLVLAVAFAASTGFVSPVGYRTNLFVYGPGCYDFVDCARAGAALQVLLAVVTTLGIVLLRGI